MSLLEMIQQLKRSTSQGILQQTNIPINGMISVIPVKYSSFLFIRVNKIRVDDVFDSPNHYTMTRIFPYSDIPTNRTTDISALRLPCANQ
jgi:hypothetical protein